MIRMYKLPLFLSLALILPYARARVCVRVVLVCRARAFLVFHIITYAISKYHNMYFLICNYQL